MKWMLESPVFTLAAVALVLSACTASPTPESGTSSSALTARIVQQGLLACFPAGLAYNEGEAVTCEASAVVVSVGDAIVANDKAVPGPGRSSLFALPAGDVGGAGTLPRYLTAPAVLVTRKFEAMTVTPDGSFILASTAFDRIKPDSAEWDSYNVLLAWPAGEESRVTLVDASRRDGVTSSRGIREKMAKALRSDAFPDGAPYFKVEGLAALPEDRLLFGIREVGRSYKDFDYTITIVEAPFQVRQNDVFLGEAFRLAYSFDASQVAELGGKTVGLSSLEYDPVADRLYLLTSHEPAKSDEGLSGFLWTLTLEDFDAGRPPELIRADDGQPLVFAHKPEGLALVDAERLLIVHDDDRVFGCQDAPGLDRPLCRAPHQAPFAKLHLSSAAD